MVKVVIRKPSGEVVAYEPLIDLLVGEREQIIRRDELVRDSAYIGFGKGGFYFDQPGHYRIRAVYAALDGSEVMSNIITVRVRYPVTPAEDSLAELFMGDEQGTLLYLLGSDDESLKSGNAAFDEVLEKHGKHPMANYARLVKGVNAARDFKTVTEGNRVEVRQAQLDESARLLSAAADSRVLDSVSTQMILANLAEVQTRAGDEVAAQKTLATLSAMKTGTA
jgi:biotin carboxyl carrier protein